MNIKKQVAENIQAFFKKELKALNHDIWKNKQEIKRLVEKQTLLKRTKAELDQLSRTIK
jgi:hypothetical protein